MTAAERQAIIAAAHRHAVESARAQGLPAAVTDSDAIRQVAALIRPAETIRRVA